MPYELRPGNKLKRPVRFLSLSDDDYNLRIIPHLEPPIHYSEESAIDMLSKVAHLPTRDTSFTSPPPSSRLEPVTAPTSPSRVDSSDTLRHTHTMAKVKNVRSYLRHKIEAREKRDDDAAPVVRVSKPPMRPAVEHAEPPPYCFFPNAGAFSRRPVDRAEPAEEYGRHGLMQRMEARRKCDVAAEARCSEQARLMWSNEEFPGHMDVQQRMWYSGVQERRQVRDAGKELEAHTKDEEAEVEEYDVLIEFVSLYPSIRETIIAEIKSDFPLGYYHDENLPVKEILQISASTLRLIREEQAEIGNNLSKYALKFKQQNPDDTIDPDLPLPHEVVKAMDFLVQMHLPGSLLGKWQFPVPHVEAFLTPFVPIHDEIIARDLGTESIDKQASDEEPWEGFNLTRSEAFLKHVTEPFGKAFGGAGPVAEVPYLHNPSQEGADRHPGLKRNAAAISKIYDGYEGLITTNTEDPKKSHKTATTLTSLNVSISSSRQVNQSLSGKLHTLSRKTRAKMHADRLWAEHNFNHKDLCIKPLYLNSKPTTSHQASIQLELILKWHSAIEAKLQDARKINYKATFHPEYKMMKDFLNRLAERAAFWQTNFVESLHRKEKVISTPQATQAPQVAPVPQARKKEAGATKSIIKKPIHPKPTAQVPNHGFAASTLIIPFATPTSLIESISGVKRHAPEDATAAAQVPKLGRPPKKVKTDDAVGSVEASQYRGGEAAESQTQVQVGECVEQVEQQFWRHGSESGSATVYTIAQHKDAHPITAATGMGRTIVTDLPRAASRAMGRDEEMENDTEAPMDICIVPNDSVVAHEVENAYGFEEAQ